MKRVLYSVFLIIGMSIAFCSCEKEEGGGKVDDNIIEGRWYYPVKQDDYFNGQIVHTGSYTYQVELEKVMFQNSNATCVYKDGETIVYPYSIIDGKLTLLEEPFYVITANKKEIVLETHYDGHVYENEKAVLTTFKGVDIYGLYRRVEYDNTYKFLGTHHGWYYDKKGKAVSVYRVGGDYSPKTESYWDEKEGVSKQRIIKFDYDYWSDNSRLFFKAE